MRGILVGMATELTPQVVDLTGLPEPAIQAIRQLVQTLREMHRVQPDGETSTAATFPKYISRPRLTPAEFEQKLNELATGPRLPPLPADFSRADIYDDHD